MYCLNAVFLVNSWYSRFYAFFKNKKLLIANVRSQFAEFLKDYSTITWVYATHPLVSDLVQSCSLIFNISCRFHLHIHDSLPEGQGTAMRKDGMRNES